MEANLGLSQKIANDIMFINKFRGTNYLCEQIDKVKMEDIHRVTLRMMNSSRKPALVVIGDISVVPAKDTVDSSVAMIMDMYRKKFIKQ